MNADRAIRDFRELKEVFIQQQMPGTRDVVVGHYIRVGKLLDGWGMSNATSFGNEW